MKRKWQEQTIFFLCFFIFLTMPLIKAYALTITGVPPADVSEDTAYSFTPTVSDVDGTATFSITNPPAWATFDPATGTLSGTPTNDNVGTTTDIEIRVTDSSSTQALALFNLTVHNVNDPPVISGTPATSVSQGSPYSFTPTATDADADTLTFSITNKPSWATFNTEFGTLSGTPGNEHVGTTTGIVITVTDGSSPQSLPAFDITVTNVNDEPVISGTPATSVPERATYTFTPTASDPDGGDTLTFNITNPPSWATFDTNTGTLTGTPSEAHVNTTTSGIVISVTDASSLSASLPAFDITVTNVNDGPVISGTPPTSVSQDALYTFTPTASDPDTGDTLTFSVTNAPSWASFNTNTGILSGTPDSGDVATTSGIVISVSDAGGLSASLAAFSIEVINVNDGPVITGNPATNVSEDSPYNFTPVASDADGDTLSFSIQNAPSWSSFNSEFGTLSGTPNNDDVGTTNGIIISVTDGTLTDSLPSFNLTVINVNDEPTISGSPTTTINHNDAYSFTPTAFDPDVGDSLTFNITNKPSWANFNSSTGELSGTPGIAGTGTASDIRISVTDNDGLSASLPSFSITATNVAPTATDTSITTDEDVVFTGTLPAADGDGDTLTYEIVDQGTIGTINITDTSTGAFTYSPAANLNGSDSFTFKVSDGLEESNVSTVIVTVVPVVDPVVITSTAPTSATLDELYTYTPTIENFDNATVVWSLAVGNIPSGMTVDPDTGVVSWVASFDGILQTLDSSGEVTLVAEADNGTTDTEAFTIAVTIPIETRNIEIAINAGGRKAGAFTSYDTTPYIADQYYSGGEEWYTFDWILGTSEDAIYQTYRWSDTSFSYNIPVANRSYQVILKMVEIHHEAAGLQIFNISVEGSEIASNVDIFAEVGKLYAYKIEVPVTVSDGELNIVCTAVTGDAVLSAIKVVY